MTEKTEDTKTRTAKAEKTHRQIQHGWKGEKTQRQR